jgi:hypothetical protein
MIHVAMMTRTISRDYSIRTRRLGWLASWLARMVFMAKYIELNGIK